MIFLLNKCIILVESYSTKSLEFPSKILHSEESYVLVFRGNVLEIAGKQTIIMKASKLGPLSTQAESSEPGFDWINETLSASGWNKVSICFLTGHVNRCTER